jgi:hypothetical protein
VAALALALTLAPLGPFAGAPAHAMPIEGYPSYDPQNRCSPAPKLGMVMLSEHLLRRYPGSGSSGISRSCTASGVSEHKEGRAFDWRLDATSERDQRYAADFLERLLAADRAGNANALARRMGIMYVIWDDRIWSASHGYRARDYLHAACQRVRGCSPTLRHRDHMHISLTRAAARGATSWYLRRLPDGTPPPRPAPAPAPQPEPRPAPDPRPGPAPGPDPRSEREPEPPTVPKRAPRRRDGVIDLRRYAYTRVRVPANGEVVETGFKLRGGVTYSLTAAGLYSFGGPDEVADAVCTWSRRDQAWVPRPRRAVKRRYGDLALVVNGRRPFERDCRGSHTYRTEFSTEHDRKLRLQVRGRHPSSRGRITVVIGRKRARVRPALPAYTELTPAPTYSTNPLMGSGLVAETLRLDATEGVAFTRQSLAPGARYRVTVSGVVRFGGHVRSDGRCVFVRGTWYDAASIDRRVPGQDHGHLYLAGKPFEGGSRAGCGGDEHVGEIVADSRGRLRLDLWDPLELHNNTGELTVTVQRLSPIDEPRAARRQRVRPRKEPWQRRREVLTLDPGAPGGIVSGVKLRKGERARIVVTGRYRSGDQRADASCVRTGDGWQRTDPDVALGQDPLDVWVDGQRVRWHPLGGGRPCSTERRYGTQFTATKPGPVRISVFDLDHTDNEGELEVVVRRLGRR